MRLRYYICCCSRDRVYSIRFSAMRLTFTTFFIIFQRFAAFSFLAICSRISGFCNTSEFFNSDFCFLSSNTLKHFKQTHSDSGMHLPLAPCGDVATCEKQNLC